VQITDDSNVDGYTVGHTTAPFLSYYAPTAPAAASPFNVAASAPAFTSGTMYNLGPNPRLDVWSIQANRVLTRTDVLHATPPLQVGEGVINLKAEFGADANGNNVIDPGEWSAVAPADWRTLFAIRVAVLVRSRQFERNGDPGASGVRAVTPTAANPFYFGDRTRLFLMRNVDGTADSFGDAAADPNNWRYYRYRVYERVIPLRNMLWGNFG
jgi:type IV pilus assembly protein PilW